LSLRWLDSAMEVVGKEQNALMDEYFPGFFEVSNAHSKGKLQCKFWSNACRRSKSSARAPMGFRKLLEKRLRFQEAAELARAAGASIGLKHTQNKDAFKISLMAGRLALADAVQILARMEAALVAEVYTEPCKRPGGDSFLGRGSVLDLGEGTVHLEGAESLTLAGQAPLEVGWRRFPSKPRQAAR